MYQRHHLYTCLGEKTQACVYASGIEDAKRIFVESTGDRLYSLPRYIKTILISRKNTGPVPRARIRPLVRANSMRGRCFNRGAASEKGSPPNSPHRASLPRARSGGV